MPWYKNTSIWSAIIAVIAIFLSQLPPIKNWIPNDNLTLKYGDRITVNNAIGLTGYHVNLGLNNDGNTSLKIESIALAVKGPSGVEKRYIAETLSTPTAGGGFLNLPVTSLSLKQKESWSGSVFFNRKVSPSEEEKFNEVRLKVSQNISDKIQLQNWGDYNPRALVSADAEIVEEAAITFNENFDLQKGLHEAKIEIKLRGKEDLIIESLEYTLYDYHFSQIMAQVEDYKYGYGIYLPHLPNKTVSVKVRPRQGAGY